MIEAVIFDLGGVIVRTEDYAGREALADRFGMTRLALEDLVFGGDSGDRAQLGQITSDEHWENIRRQLGLEQIEMGAFQDSFWSGDVVDWKLVEHIRTLRRQHKTALLSNAFSSLRHFVTEVWKFDDAFDGMIISAEVGLVKPDARIYHLALERLGVASQATVFIDDFERNIHGAQAAGLHAIHFRSPSQLYRDLAGLLNGGPR